MKVLINTFLMHRYFNKTKFYKGAYANRLCFLEEYTVLFKDAKVLNSKLGKYSYIQANSIIYNSEIGPYCSISNNVTIGLASHPINMVSTSPIFYDNTQPLPYFFTDKQLFSQTLPKTIIGADVWIGQNVMIKAGVNIGVGCVIGAGSVVTKDIEPFSVIGGIPARLIKRRFIEETCQGLLESKWWEISAVELQKISPYFSEPEEMLKALKSIKGS